MPPNKKGGKNYKKGKHIDDEPIIYERQEDQMYGRVLKLLGSCNVLVYCNDGYERLCHIRGSMRKKVWISTGDIVLISIRDLTNQGTNEILRGDICAKYDQRVIYRLKQKDSTINDKLFTNIEKTDNLSGKQEEEGYIFDSNDRNSDSNSDNTSESDVDEVIKPINRSLQKKIMEMHEDDIDIDKI